MNQCKSWIAALLVVTAISACFPERPERLNYPLSTVTGQSADNYDLTIYGKRFLTHDKDGIRFWAKLLVDQGIPVGENTTLIDLFPDARYAPHGPFADIGVNDPAFVDWVMLEGTQARRFQIDSPICAPPHGYNVTIKCPELDAILITPEVLYGVSRMVGLEDIRFTGMYAGTQEELINGLQAIIDAHNPKVLNLYFVSEDGVPPNLCALRFGDALRVLNWVELETDHPPQYKSIPTDYYGTGRQPMKVRSPFDLVHMKVRDEKIATFQSEICGD